MYTEANRDAQSDWNHFKSFRKDILEEIKSGARNHSNSSSSSIFVAVEKLIVGSHWLIPLIKLHGIDILLFAII